MSTEKGQIIERLVEAAFTAQHHPTRMQQPLHNYNIADIRLGRYEGVEGYTGLTENDYETMEPATAKAILSRGQARGEAELAIRAHWQLGQFEDKRQRAAWFLSACDTSTKYMSSNIGINSRPDRYFAPDVFRLAGRALLGIGPTNEPEHTQKVCRCRMVYTVGEEPFHAHSCNSNKGLRTLRHNAIVKCLEQLCMARYKAPPGGVVAGVQGLIAGVQVMREAEVGTKADNSAVIADVVVTVHGVRQVMDVLVIDMGAKGYLQGPPGTNPAFTVDAAARKGEMKKIRHYSGVVHPARIPEAYVVPFVLEATGRLGPRALHFIREMTGPRTALRSRFIGQVSRICALFTGLMLQATRDRYLPLPG